MTWQVIDNLESQYPIVSVESGEIKVTSLPSMLGPLMGIFL